MFNLLDETVYGDDPHAALSLVCDALYALTTLREDRECYGENPREQAGLGILMRGIVNSLDDVAALIATRLNEPESGLHRQRSEFADREYKRGYSEGLAAAEQSAKLASYLAESAPTEIRASGGHALEDEIAADQDPSIPAPENDGATAEVSGRADDLKKKLVRRIITHLLTEDGLPSDTAPLDRAVNG